MDGRKWSLRFMAAAAAVLLSGLPVYAGVVQRKVPKEQTEKEKSHDTAWERALDDQLEGRSAYPELTEDDGPQGAPTDYSYLTAAFRARNPFAVSRTDDRGRSLTSCIDRGTYYELTNVSFYAYKKYDAADVRATEPGETFRIDGKAYVVKETGPQDADGYSEYTLERTDGYGNITRAYLVPVHPGKNKKTYYIAEKRGNADGSFDSAELYATGSMFLKKDASVVSANAGADGLKKVVTAAQYLTMDSSLLPSAAAGGVIAGNGNGNAADRDFEVSAPSARSEEIFLGGYREKEGLIVINGSFALDAEGYVVSFAEKP